MRKFLTLVASAAVLASPAFAHARGFDTDFTQKVTGPFKLEVVVSDDLAYRANNLPKKLSDRNFSSRLNSGFSNNGQYGDRAIEYLIKELEEDLVRDFKKRDLSFSDAAPTLLRVTIVDARPNRPTSNQLGKDPGLSYSSFGVGGADVSAEFIGAGGNVVGTAEIDYFPSFNDRGIDFVQSSGTWTDTQRTFSQFSRRLSKKLAAMEEESS